MSITDTTPDITSDDTERSLSIPEAAVEFAELLAFETMVKDAVAARRSQLAARMGIAEKETGAKSFSARHPETNDVMVDFTIKQSTAHYEVADKDDFTDWVIINHPTEVDTTVTITDQAAFTEWVRENSPEWAKVDFKVKAAFEKVMLAGKTLTRPDADTIVTEDGVLVEGMKWVPAHSLGVLHPTWKPGGKELAARAVIAGAADNLLSAFLADTTRELQAAPENAA